MAIWWAVVSTILISLLSLVGIFLISVKKQVIQKNIIHLVALSAGTMMGGVFFHLLPEAVEGLGIKISFAATLTSFFAFLMIEKLLAWRHCHHNNCKEHTFGYMNLIGDSVHNFIDGLLIAGAFGVDIKLGIVTSLAVAIHELPQEMGDFGVLLHAGFTRSKALSLNLLVALTAVLGAIIGSALSSHTQNLAVMLLPVAAGGFLYISTGDLLPELKKQATRPMLKSAAVFLVGVGIMYFLTFV